MTERANDDLPNNVTRALELARKLQERAGALQTPQERRQQAEFERLVQNPEDKATLMLLTDQAFRSRRPARSVDQLTHILDVQGIPRFFSAWDRAMLKGFQSFGDYLPTVSMPMVKDRLRSETANVVLPGETDLLAVYLTERRKSGVRMNVNYLGEALLGEEDAKRRLRSYLQALQRPEIEVISVKVSTLYSQITPLSHAHSLRVLSGRMELLYRAAQKNHYQRPDGSSVQKFVYLDMEEYRDLELTLQTLMQTLDKPGLEQASAGIAMQAYVPDSYPALLRLQKWAKARVEAGGAPVTVRLVKGANMEAERVEASIAGWAQAPYKEKSDTDANFKRMLQATVNSDALRYLRIGVASHNLFDVAYALVLAQEHDALDLIQFEMLEGMANHQRRALSEHVDNLLLYAPATKRDEFVNAIGYLVRRLDENTGPDNFLRHAFKVEVGNDEWQSLEKGFLESFKRLGALTDRPRRTQDRTAPAEREAPLDSLADFRNSPDTDFSLPQNRTWAERIVADWHAQQATGPIQIPLVVAGKEIAEDRTMGRSNNPSQPKTVVAEFCHATRADVDAAIACAKADPDGFRSLSSQERCKLLFAAAQAIEDDRADLLGAAMIDGGKLLSESDPEVSEAIDFVRYYAASARAFSGMDSVQARPKGVVAVVSPWNFPIAIPCGGISAALAAGNSVILKPSSDTVLCAYRLCQSFWKAGIPKTALQFLPCDGVPQSAQLVASTDVDGVVLTGGTHTALAMLEERPDMPLLAETGGKNATIVTALADREQAIKHVIRSAFGHSGQKCSATSLLILEGEVYDDPAFKATLCDAVRSLQLGPAHEFHTRVGPLVRPPQGALERALKELEAGESWAVLPKTLRDNPHLHGPAVKWGVTRGSYTHQTEFFGPVLAVMRAPDLLTAIEIANETGYGLTAGLESLDLREQDVWRERIRAGNLYINRPTTGAIVQRQPFGGVGKSAFGAGIKAGGPNYVAQFMDFEDGPDAATTGDTAFRRDTIEALTTAMTTRGDFSESQRKQVIHAIQSYEAAFESEFETPTDVQQRLGQDNLFYYVPVGTVRVRVDRRDTPFDVVARVCAAHIAGCRVTVSTAPDRVHPAVEALEKLTESWAAAIEFVEESDQELAAVIREALTDRVRYANKDRVPEVVRRAVGASGVHIADSPVLAEGRLELMWVLNEQSLSINYHRYGNLGARAAESRHEPD